MRWRRDRDDNADLSDEEYAWWTGRDRRKEAGQPPDGIPERRAVVAANVAQPAPAPPPSPAPPPPPPGPEPAPPVASLPPLIAVTPEPTTFPFEREAAGAPEGADAGAGAGAERDPAADPWHRSTSPQALAAYRTLGIDWEASWDEVVEVFRDHAALWHPDRLAGTDPLVQAEGQRRMSEMTRAYRELQRMLRPSRRELFSS